MLKKIIFLFFLISFFQIQDVQGSITMVRLEVFYNSMTQLLNDSFEDIKIFNRILSKNELREHYKAQVLFFNVLDNNGFSIR